MAHYNEQSGTPDVVRVRISQDMGDARGLRDAFRFAGKSARERGKSGVLMDLRAADPHRLRLRHPRNRLLARRIRPRAQAHRGAGQTQPARRHPVSRNRRRQPGLLRAGFHRRDRGGILVGLSPPGTAGRVTNQAPLPRGARFLGDVAALFGRLFELLFLGRPAQRGDRARASGHDLGDRIEVTGTDLSLVLVGGVAEGLGRELRLL